METVELALTKLDTVKPQTKVEVVRGVNVRRTRAGIPVVSIHYSADPERDPNPNPEWRRKERAKYTSQASWDREQEIVDNAGGGELVFADTLVTYWNKIVITDPAWRPDPMWRVEGGMDHGKTNPTALERAYIDFQGSIILCGEWFQGGWEIWQHAAEIKKMADVRKISACYADPTIFYDTMQQSSSAGKQEKAKSVNELYCEAGIELFSPFAGDRSDVSFAARIMQHWANLDVREPTLKIVCRNYAEQWQPGLHNWDCPNLLLEMMRRRRVKLTAKQLLARNPSEALVDKENHASDALKYLALSHPEPTQKTIQQRAAEKVAEVAQAGDLTSSAIRYQQAVEEYSAESQPARLGRYR